MSSSVAKADWQLEILMEKLRAKAPQYKSITELSKSVRMTMLDKRYALDSVDKGQHQQCLDRLQQFIKVTSLQSMCERLESLTRQLGFKFMIGPSGVELFISSDMFYLEIVLEVSGTVKDVKVHHESKAEQQSCTELVACLSRGDFVDFATQLEGFAAIYQLNAEKKSKCKAFTALLSLESDLSTLAQLQSFMKEPFNVVHKSPVGVLEKRRGGHPMKLTYFVSPYELINVDVGDLSPITIEHIIAKALGYSVTVCIAGSTTHKLQTTTLITVNRNMNGKSTPSFSSQNSQNSAAIMACFLLKLNNPLPICLSLLRQIEKITDIDCREYHLSTAPQPILGLICNHVSQGILKPSHGLFVTLPDQTHCYFLTENRDMDGVLISAIPFTHPAHVSQILTVLRQQALFNTVISSCVRSSGRQDFDNMIVVEVSALSPSHISLTLEHPYEESMATAELDIREISHLVCNVKCPGVPVSPPPILLSSSSSCSSHLDNSLDSFTSELCARVLNRTFSIPVTVRAMILQWQKQQATKRLHQLNGQENYEFPQSSSNLGRTLSDSSNSGSNAVADFGGGVSRLRSEHSFKSCSKIASSTIQMPSHLNLQQSNIEERRSLLVGIENTAMTNVELAHILSDNADPKCRRTAIEHGWQHTTSGFPTEERNVLSENCSNDSSSRSTQLSHDTEASMPASFTMGCHSSDVEMVSQLHPTDAHSDSENWDKPSDDRYAGTRKDHESAAKGTVESHRTHGLSSIEKNFSAHNVSIVPVVSSNSMSFPSLRTDTKREDTLPGIEIIPLVSSSAATLCANSSTVSAVSSSITITPVTAVYRTSGSETLKRTTSDGDSNRKRQRSLSDESNNGERKRKHKHDDNSPLRAVVSREKLIGHATRLDPLSKPVSISIKAAEPSLSSVQRSLTSIPSQKYNTANSVNRSSSNSTKSLGKSTSSLSHNTSSLKSNQVHVLNTSPKHCITITSSTAGGLSNQSGFTKQPLSGKSSAGTLKSSASSPSKSNAGSVAEKIARNVHNLSATVSLIARDKDRDKKSGDAYTSSTKGKLAKLKMLTDYSSCDVSNTNDIVPTSPNQLSMCGGDVKITLQATASKNRKGCLSAIVDKLKSAQCDGVIVASTTADVNCTSSGKIQQQIANDESIDGAHSIRFTVDNNSTATLKTQEYMVKPSLDGMKITINKTRTKDFKWGGSIGKHHSSSSKTHTGLKPGVISGPASKKHFGQPVGQQRYSVNSMVAPSSLRKSASGNTCASAVAISGSPLATTGSSSAHSKTVANIANKLTAKSSNCHSKLKTHSGETRPLKPATKTNKGSISDKTLPPSKLSTAMVHNDDNNAVASDVNVAYKIPGYNSSAPLVIDGVVKQFDKNFHIPKLSARQSDEKNGKLSHQRCDGKNSSSSKSDQIGQQLEDPTNNTCAKDDDYTMESVTSTQDKRAFNREDVNQYKLNYSILGVKNVLPVSDGSCGKFVIGNRTTTTSTTDAVMDLTSIGKPTPFSGGAFVNKDAAGSINKHEWSMKKTDENPNCLNNVRSESKSGACIEKLPQMSPLHVISPSPSSLITASSTPHSISPGITDDELMDEALIGLDK